MHPDSTLNLVWVKLVAEFDINSDKLDLYHLLANTYEWKRKDDVLASFCRGRTTSKVVISFKTLPVGFPENSFVRQKPRRRSGQHLSPVPNAVVSRPDSATVVSKLTLPTIAASGVVRLVRVWDSPYARKGYHPVTKKAVMDCLACGRQFAGHHATRLVWHFAKKTRPGGIGICTYAFSEEEEIQFMDLLQQREERCAQNESRRLTISAAVSARTETAALDRRSSNEEVELITPVAVGRTATQLIANAPDSEPIRRGLMAHFSRKASSKSSTTHSTASTSLARPLGVTSKHRATKRQIQGSLVAGLRAQTQHVGVDCATRCDASIADFFFSSNTPTSLVESAEFRHMLYCNKQTEPDYSAPTNASLSGPLLSSCFSTHRTTNNRIMGSDANTYGLSLLSDSATVGGDPLSNILGHNPNSRAVCLDVVDSTDHLVKGGKKDARYIARYMIRQLKKVDPESKLVDQVMFDGARNMKNAGKIITNYNPRILSVHGGEHNTALWFNDMAKLNPIKVRLFNFLSTILCRNETI